MGKDKRQILQYLDSPPIVFFGDKTQPKGNDFVLACAKNLTHSVVDWNDTWDRLKLFTS